MKMLRKQFRKHNIEPCLTSACCTSALTLFVYSTEKTEQIQYCVYMHIQNRT